MEKETQLRLPLEKRKMQMNLDYELCCPNCGYKLQKSGCYFCSNCGYTSCGGES